MKPYHKEVLVASLYGAFVLTLFTLFLITVVSLFSCSLDEIGPDSGLRNISNGDVYSPQILGEPVECKPYSYTIVYNGPNKLGTITNTNYWAIKNVGQTNTFPDVQILYCDLQTNWPQPICPAGATCSGDLNAFPLTDKCITAHGGVIDQDGNINIKCDYSLVYTDIIGGKTGLFNYWQDVRVYVR